MDEACRIGIHLTAQNTVDVGAPMQHKPLCYEMLAAARHVIDRTADQHFSPAQRRIAIVMQMTGNVDVSAPLPPRELCYLMLDQAQQVIERYNDDSAPELRAFSDAVMG